MDPYKSLNLKIHESIDNGQVSDLDISEEEEDPEQEIFERHNRRCQGIFSDSSSDSSNSEPNDEMQNSNGITDVPTTSNTLPKSRSNKDITWTQLPFPSVDIVLDDIEVPDPVTTLRSPIDYFMQYFNEELFETVAINTNLYAAQNNAADFTPTNKKEIQTLIAVHLIMDCIKCPTWKEILKVPIIFNNMQLDRFIQLRNNLHIINNADIPKNNQDKFIKVRPLYNQIKQKCNELPKSRNLAIGEQIVPFKRILKNKRYKSDKVGPWRVKMFVLVSNSGMVYDFILYQANSTELNQNNLKQFGFGASVVLHLVQNLKKNSHFLAFEESFSTYPLLEHLYNLGIYANGRVIPKHFGNPPLLSNRQMLKLGRGTTFEISSKVNNECSIGLVKWYHNGSIIIGSNFVTSGSTEMVKSYDIRLLKSVMVEIPEVLKLYKSCIVGLHKHDDLINSYRTVIKTKKWTLQLIINAFNLVASNAWIQYKKEAEELSIPQRKILDWADFRLQLGSELLGDTDRPIPPDNVRYDQMHHWPMYDNLRSGTKCKNPACSRNRNKTHCYCEKCKVHLCLTRHSNCFLEFHTDDSNKENK